MVGISYARALSHAARKPLIEVDHIKAHLYANCLRGAAQNSLKSFLTPQLPAIGLVISGGHSSVFYVNTFRDYRLLGQTRDDAAGEAFDKVARILGLGYPGGPAIDRLSRKGVNTLIRFPSARLPGSYDFSFSGVKTAVLYYHREHKNRHDYSVPKIAYAFQDSVVTALIDKCITACVKKKVKTLLMGGGVAANSNLRNRLAQEAQRHEIEVYFPPLNLCLDNAAMIAGLGFHLKSERR